MSLNPIEFTILTRDFLNIVRHIPCTVLVSFLLHLLHVVGARPLESQLLTSNTTVIRESFKGGKKFVHVLMYLA